MLIFLIDILVKKMTTIDISDINLHQLIIALWDCSRPASFFDSNDAFLGKSLPPALPTAEEINQSFSGSGRIDYLAGRAIKTNFSDPNNVDTTFYDKYHGEGSFEKIVEQLRTNNAHWSNK
jgi:hypothetical protein